MGDAFVADKPDLKAANGRMVEMARKYKSRYQPSCVLGYARRNLLLVGRQRRLDEHPEKMRQRRETAEHPFGTIKARMGVTHFVTKGYPILATLDQAFGSPFLVEDAAMSGICSFNTSAMGGGSMAIKPRWKRLHSSMRFAHPS